MELTAFLLLIFLLLLSSHELLRETFPNIIIAGIQDMVKYEFEGILVLVCVVMPSVCVKLWIDFEC
jgi:hypothetical protein